MGGLKVVQKDTSGGVLGDFVGTITNRGDKYGFIECDELDAYGAKVFVMWDEFKNYKKGQKVRFTAFLTGDKQLQAKNLRSGLKEPAVEKIFKKVGVKKPIIKSKFKPGVKKER